MKFDAYENLMQSRPYKFLPDEVNYRDAETDVKCSTCLHYYTREIDGYAVCEIMRDVKSDEEENPIKPDYVCDFHTIDGDSFPLLKESHDG